MVYSVQIMKKQETQSITNVIPTLEEHENILPTFEAAKKVFGVKTRKVGCSLNRQCVKRSTKTLAVKNCER